MSGFLNPSPATAILTPDAPSPSITPLEDYMPRTPTALDTHTMVHRAFSCLTATTRGEEAESPTQLSVSTPGGTGGNVSQDYHHSSLLDRETASPPAAGAPPYDDLLIPPLNFGRVCRGVYRSGFPGRKNFHFLRKLGLRSVVNLSEHEYAPETMDFFRASGMQWCSLMVKGNKEPFQSSDEEVIRMALHMVLDATPDKPLLLHCTKGTHRTGCVVGCLRKLEGWSLTPIFDEYRRYAGTKVHLLDQQFIEFFTPTREHREKELKTRRNR